MDPALEIDGRQYEWPGLMSLTNRECRIFYEETGVVWESLWLDGMTVKDMALKEGFMAAMARIAYTREHPDTASPNPLVLAAWLSSLPAAADLPSNRAPLLFSPLRTDALQTYLRTGRLRL